MSKLDVILRKRLERIREELNSFIESRSFAAEAKVSTPKIESIVQETEEDTAQQPKKTAQSDRPVRLTEEQVKRIVERFSQSQSPGSPQYLSTGYSSGASGGGSAGPAMAAPQYLMRDSGRPELDEVLAKKEESFSTMLLRLIDERDMKDSDVYRRADIDRRLFSKIRGDEGYVPSKKTAISFCLALQLELEDAKKLLATAGYTLSASSRFDLIITYLIENSEYNIQFANIVLDDYGEGTLSR